ncbi:lysozyme like domain [Acinetobacter phage WCHABP12]|uniref:Lysozyme like domain n=1 Tax=Acinetobacter phage WCHABP12 TaxID=1965454 RepID=A0A1V0DZ47_9CAUD|nr:lysozyme like domain [Acinetobacter phage WCHABP12]ARB06747.1 lysozyme like domain [Acinetobacter phage WCHABP12]
MAENIVESIIVKLGLDGSQYNREAEKAKSNNDKLNKSVSETDKAVSTVTGTITRFFGILAAATGILRMVDQVQKLNDELYHLERNLGMSASTIKNWQGAAGAMGGSAQGMTESIKSLNMGMNDFVTMGDTTLLPFMNALGVGMVDAQGKLRKTDDVMLDLADSFSKMDREQAFSIASKMGIDEGTFNTLVQGRKEMEKMLEYQSKMYKSSEEELKASRQLAQNRALLGQHWESLKTMMADAIIPLFVKLSEVALGIFEYLQEHEDQVKGVFTAISFTIGAILIPILAKATIAALAFIAPFAPFILVVGALGAAFGLLYDDYKTWAEGGKSLFDWGAFKKYIDDSTLSVDNLKNAFSNLGKDMLNNAIPTLKGYAEILNKLVSGDFKGAALQAWDMLKNYYSRAADFVDDLTGQKQGTLANAVGNLVNPGTSPATGNAQASYKSKAFTPEKAASIARVAKNIGVNPNDLAAVISFETGGTFSPSKRNPNSSATGLIQFMAGSGGTKGKYYGMTRDQFGSLSFDEQMKYVEKYFKDRSSRFRAGNEAKNTTGDVYGAVTGYGYKKGSREYELNKVWDSNKNGIIEKGEMVQNPSFRAHQRKYFDMSNVAAVQQSTRQGDFIDLTKARQNQSTANKANEVQVNVGDINIQTSSSTVTGNVQDAMGAIKDQFYQFRNSFN